MMEILDKMKLMTVAAGIGILFLTIVCGNPDPMLITSGFSNAGYISSANAEPPPWAPAHGYRAKHQYHYYPSSQVYYDIGRRLYFYVEGGNWRFGASLPVGIKVGLGDHVTLEMDTDKPYEFHADVVKEYPSGEPKEKNKGEEKRKDKGKNKASDKGKK